jgi:hypothetical protein
MKKIYLPKGAGKTRELVKMAHNTNKYIVCANSQEAARIAANARKEGYNILFPLTYGELISRRYFARNIESFLIDNVEQLISHISYVPIEAITITKE